MDSLDFSLHYHALKFILRDVCFDTVCVLYQTINGIRRVCVYDRMICCCKEDMPKREAEMKKEEKEVRV